MQITLTAALAVAASATEIADTPSYNVYDADHEHYGQVPTGNFWEQVDDFDEWKTIRDQDEYESRLDTEASLMIALEALREALTRLDMDIDELDYGISQNESDIEDNDREIEQCFRDTNENIDEISDQFRQVDRLQRQCRRCQNDIDENRDLLILYCQQFAFAPDMVGACADILTCAGTELDYRWDSWTGAGHSHPHSHGAHYHEHRKYAPEPAINHGHYQKAMADYADEEENIAYDPYYPNIEEEVAHVHRTPVGEFEHAHDGGDYYHSH